MKAIVTTTNIAVVLVTFTLDDFLVTLDILGSVWSFSCDTGFG